MTGKNKDWDAEFTDFVVHRSPPLLRTAYLLAGGDREAARDLLQDVLERMYPRWPRITGSPEAYARGALANTAANRWRRLSRRVRETPLAPGQLTPVVAGPEEAVVTADQVAPLLASLPPRMRAVIVLRFFDDLSEKQVAQALGCGIGTVKSQTSRGLARMRDALRPDGPGAARLTPTPAGGQR
ncbi:SigE family RNA polymerase sigma factor [Actinoalloteichus spitiensis]|uniref:SigE family RNA polymerase sigma factor n=1 Tax=Actinoalloteichus spitiensis TaxID=252394 RepID=UPI00036F806A|nr:SigE family RNA polymerase sigma factor [Actinoalloteichus spitiensis]